MVAKGDKMKQDVQKISLASLACEEMSRHPNDQDAAVKALVRRLRGDPALLHKVVREAIYVACVETIDHQNRRIRNKILYEAMVRGDTHEAATALCDIVKMTLFDTPMTGGKRLGDMTRPELLACSEVYRRQARTKTHRARFLFALAAQLPDDKTSCEKVISLERATAILNETKEEA